MRSRYSAYALKLYAYLFKTDQNATAPLQDDGVDRRFAGLRILEVTDYEVLFYAKIYERGADHSFAELSRFAHVPERGWLYVSGIFVPASRLPKDPSQIDRSLF
jgi:SEC-C motif-containing protein